MNHAWLVVVLVVGGCGASVRQEAETAYVRGNFRQAAALFDRVVAKNPTDVGARNRRTDARRQVLREMLRGVQGARTIGKPALATTRLGALLDQRTAWQMAIDPASVSALAIEVTATAADLDLEIVRATNTRGPLTGEHTLAGYGKLLAHPDFGNRADVMRGRIVDVGRATCSKLAISTSAEQPYWSWTVDRYCRHWGNTTVQVPAFPDLRQRLVVDGAVTGQSDTQNDRMRAALAHAFRASAWFASTGTGTARATFDGTTAATFSSRDVTLSKDWTEEVAYTDYVTESESYQQAYDDTESYTEQVPYTDWETKTESCGNTTCTRSESVTKYRTEWKTRTVTKSRTAWRDVQKAVTKYRDVEHVYTWAAIERLGHYTSKLSVTILREPESRFADVHAAISRDDHARGIDHDVTFGPAGIVPQRAGLETRDDLIVNERERLQERLIAVLDAKYAATYCAAARYDQLEDAAACAYLDLARAPVGVHDRLRVAFGDDEKLVAPLLARDLR